MHQLLIDSVILVMVLSAVPMVLIAFASGFVALLQAATQIQEQSVTHLVRIVTFVLVVVLCGDWAGAEMIKLLERSLQFLEDISRRSP